MAVHTYPAILLLSLLMICTQTVAAKKPTQPVECSAAQHWHCENGGTCWHVTGKPYCTCPWGFTGEHCETDMRPRECLMAFRCNEPYSCGNYDGNYTYYDVDARDTSSFVADSDHLCRVVTSDNEGSGDYWLNVYIYNEEGAPSAGGDYGHPGVMFNLQETNSFDYIYFRIHTTSTCFTRGKLVYFLVLEVLVSTDGLIMRPGSTYRCVCKEILPRCFWMEYPLQALPLTSQPQAGVVL